MGIRHFSSFLPEEGYETVMIIESFHKKPGMIRFLWVTGDQQLEKLPFEFVITSYDQSENGASTTDSRSKESVNFSLIFENDDQFFNQIAFDEFLMLIKSFFSCNMVRKPRIQRKRAMIIKFDREAENIDQKDNVEIYPSTLSFKDVTSDTKIGPVLKGYFSVNTDRTASNYK